MIRSEFEISQRKYLCYRLQCSSAQLDDILKNTNSYYRECTQKKKDKITGEFKTYKDGTVKVRQIRESLGILKRIQKIITTQILSSVTLPSNIHGGVKSKSNITNAKSHKGKKYKFCTDLQNFFPSITPLHVAECLKRNDFEPTWVRLITRLTTYKHEVPQGAPTSTHIANLVFLETDKLLIAFCYQHRITYTRFVDDLTFSSDQNFEDHLQSIVRIILSSGFNISYRKTKYQANQLITGIYPFNNYIEVPDKIKMKVKEESVTNARVKPYKQYLNSVRKQNRGVKKIASTRERNQKSKVKFYS